MKKRILALMLVVAAVLMTACGGKSYTPGTFTDTGYESEFLGFRFTTPDGFALATQEELSQMMGITFDALGDDVSDAQKKYAELTTLYELMAMDSLGVTNVNIVLEKTNVSMNKYLAAFKAQVESLDAMKVSLQGDAQEVEFAGATYTKLSADVSASGITLYQEYYLRKVGDRMMTITVTWADGFETSKETLMNAFSAY